MQGCYNTLNHLDISGNFLDDSRASCQTFLLMFDFLSSLQTLNMEHFKFYNFKTFKEEFMVPFLINEDYKPYQNTLRNLNLNIGNCIFYNLKPRQLSYTTCKKIIEGVKENFSYLENFKLDLLSYFIMKRENLQQIQSIFSRNVIVQLEFSE